MKNIFVNLCCILLMVGVLLGFIGCDSKGSKTPHKTKVLNFGSGSPVDRTPQFKRQKTKADPKTVVRHYAYLTYQNYLELYEKLVEENRTMVALIDHPSEKSLGAAKKGWGFIKRIHSQSQAFRFFGGAIDQMKLEDRIFPWPSFGEYIDSAFDKTKTGLLQDPNFSVDLENILAAHQKGKKENVSIGLPALEYLIWGEYSSEKRNGMRTFKDFLAPEKEGGSKISFRRSLYLTTITEILREDCKKLADVWTPGIPEAYYMKFLALEPKVALGKILTGMATLSNGYLTQMLKEGLTNESYLFPSRYSKNTRDDIFYMVLGIENILEGRYIRSDYTKFEGPAFKDLIPSSKLRSQLTKQVEKTLELLNAIKSPLEAECKSPEGKKRVAAVIKSLEAQTALFVKVAKLLKVEIQTELPK